MSMKDHPAMSVHRTFRHALLVLAFAATLVLAGCGSSGTSSSGPVGKPVSGGSIVYGADREPTCLDPHNLGDMPQAYVARQYLDSLVSEQRDGPNSSGAGRTRPHTAKAPCATSCLAGAHDCPRPTERLATAA
jgi:hypothetical protein